MRVVNEAETLQISLLRPPREDENDKRKVGIARMFARSVPLATHFRPERCGESVTFTIERVPNDGHEMEGSTIGTACLFTSFYIVIFFPTFRKFLEGKFVANRIMAGIWVESLALDPDGKDGRRSFVEEMGSRARN